MDSSLSDGERSTSEQGSDQVEDHDQEPERKRFKADTTGDSETDDPLAKLLQSPTPSTSDKTR